MLLKHCLQLDYCPKVSLCFDFLFSLRLHRRTAKDNREEPELVISDSGRYNLLTAGTVKVMNETCCSLSDSVFTKLFLSDKMILTLSSYICLCSFLPSPQKHT